MLTFPEQIEDVGLELVFVESFVSSVEADVWLREIQGWVEGSMGVEVKWGGGGIFEEPGDLSAQLPFDVVVAVAVFGDEGVGEVVAIL